MKTLMIGGTGLLGSQAARELISRGHSVHSIALPPLPEGALLPPEMTLTLKNSNDMTDDELRALTHYIRKIAAEATPARAESADGHPLKR